MAWQKPGLYIDSINFKYYCFQLQNKKLKLLSHEQERHFNHIQIQHFAAFNVSKSWYGWQTSTEMLTYKLRINVIKEADRIQQFFVFF